MKATWQQRGFFQLRQGWLRCLHIRWGREKLPPELQCCVLGCSSARWRPPDHLWPRDWGLQAQLLLQTGAGPMKRTSRLRGDRELALRFGPSVEIACFLSVIQSKTERRNKAGAENSPRAAHIATQSRSSLPAGLARPLANRGGAGVGTGREAVSLPVWPPERLRSPEMESLRALWPRYHFQQATWSDSLGRKMNIQKRPEERKKNSQAPATYWS